MPPGLFVPEAAAQSEVLVPTVRGACPPLPTIAKTVPAPAEYPEVFTVPGRFVKHMMVVADLTAADDGAVEAALEAASSLQREAG